MTTGIRTSLECMVLLLATGCAAEPVLELQEARQALAMARDFEADIYAPDQYDLAAMMLNLAEDEIDEQDGQPAWSRSYETARRYLADAVVEAEQAQLMAEEFKADVFQRAEQTLPEAQVAVDAAFEALQQARDRMTYPEAQRLEAELAAAASSLTEARQSIQAGGFADAATRLDEVIRAARAVETRARFIIETNP